MLERQRVTSREAKENEICRGKPPSREEHGGGTYPPSHPLQSEDCLGHPSAILTSAASPGKAPVVPLGWSGIVSVGRKRTGG